VIQGHAARSGNGVAPVAAANGPDWRSSSVRARAISGISTRGRARWRHRCKPDPGGTVSWPDERCARPEPPRDAAAMPDLATRPSRGRCRHAMVTRRWEARHQPGSPGPGPAILPARALGPGIRLLRLPRAKRRHKVQRRRTDCASSSGSSGTSRLGVARCVTRVARSWFALRASLFHSIPSVPLVATRCGPKRAVGLAGAPAERLTTLRMGPRSQFPDGPRSDSPDRGSSRSASDWPGRLQKSFAAAG